MVDYDILIAGAGPVGLATALSMQKAGYSVALVDPASLEGLANPRFDGREIAMTYRTREVLERLGVWELFDDDKLCPMSRARIETGDLGGEALIFASADGEKRDENAPLGWLLSNHLIRKALYERVSASGIKIFDKDSITRFKLSVDKSEMRAYLASGDVLSCNLLVAADGRFSKLRDKAGIGTFMQDFYKSVLVCRVSHPVPHDNVALQWFDHEQTLALLPVKERTEDGQYLSSVVLMLSPEEIGRLNQLNDADFSAEITARTNGHYGDCVIQSRKVIYPLKTVYAHRFFEERFALVGDAAIGMHPVTAHGFNFGIMAQDMLMRSVELASDPGDREALKRFAKALRVKTFSMYMATNAIAKLYARNDGVANFIRRTGIRAAQKFTPFKRRIVNALMESS